MRPTPKLPWKLTPRRPRLHRLPRDPRQGLWDYFDASGAKQPARQPFFMLLPGCGRLSGREVLYGSQGFSCFSVAGPRSPHIVCETAVSYKLSRKGDVIRVLCSGKNVIGSYVMDVAVVPPFGHFRALKGYSGHKKAPHAVRARGVDGATTAGAAAARPQCLAVVEGTADPGKTPAACAVPPATRRVARISVNGHWRRLHRPRLSEALTSTHAPTPTHMHAQAPGAPVPSLGHDAAAESCDRVLQGPLRAVRGRVLYGARPPPSFAADSATVERCARALVEAALVSGAAPPPQVVPAAMRDRTTLWWAGAERGQWHRFPDAVCSAYLQARLDGQSFLLYRPGGDQRSLLLPQTGKQVSIETGRCRNVVALKPREHGLHYCGSGVICGPCHSVRRAMAGEDAALGPEASGEVRKYMRAAAAAPCRCQCRHTSLRATWNALAWLPPPEGRDADAARSYVALALDVNALPGHTNCPLSQRCVSCLVRQACIDHARQCGVRAASGCPVPLCNSARQLLGHSGRTPVTSPLVAAPPRPCPHPQRVPAAAQAVFARGDALHADSLLSDAFLAAQRGASGFSLPLLAPDSGAYAEVVSALRIGGGRGGFRPTLLSARAVLHPPSAATFSAALRDAGHLPAPTVAPRGVRSANAAEASRCLLFHGTRHTDPLRVLRSGMTCQASRAVLDPGSTLYGAGLYFAESPSYVHRGRYAFVLPSGTRQMLLCRILPARVCEYGRSTDRMVAQAPADGAGRPYDTATAVTRAAGGDRIWVAYNDAHVLPVALVTYRGDEPPGNDNCTLLYSDEFHRTVSCDPVDIASPAAGEDSRLFGDAGRDGERNEDEDEDPFANVVASLSSDSGGKTPEHSADDEPPQAKRPRRDRCDTPTFCN